jgi:hypothetical protein
MENIHGSSKRIHGAIHAGGRESDEGTNRGNTTPCLNKILA